LRIVIKLGGHVFPLKLDAQRISRFVKALKKLRKEGHELVVVAGGGGNARLYIDAARKLGANEALCDEIGIEGARLNAHLLIAGLGEDAYPNIPKSIQEICAAFESGKIVVLGGLLPGQSTDAVSAIVSELVGASMLIKATDTDGIYTADPKKNPNAKKLDEVSCARLRDMLMRESVGAGEFELFDPVALRILERSKIRTLVIDGRTPQNIEKAIKGEKIGTIVTYP
jgi:uridylate kinase